MRGMDKVKGTLLERFLTGKRVTNDQIRCLLEAEKQLRVYQSQAGNVDFSLFDLYLMSLKKIPSNPKELFESIQKFLSNQFSR